MIPYIDWNREARSSDVPPDDVSVLTFHFTRVGLFERKKMTINYMKTNPIKQRKYRIDTK